MVLTCESDSQQYTKNFSVESISSVELSLPDTIPAGEYDYVIHLSTKKLIENGIFYKIKTETEGNGTITPESPLVLEGQDKTFLMTPDEGYRVKNVFVDGISIGSVTSYTFENVSQEHSLKVIFGKNGENSGSNSFIRQTPKPLTTPAPTVSPKPETTPNALPSDEPIQSATPAVNPIETPKPTDGSDIDRNTPSSKEKMRKGKKITDKKTKAVYKVTSLGKNKTAEYVKSTKKNVASISVPSVVKLGGKNFKVTSVGKSAFRNNKKLKKVKLGKNIKIISKQAFSGCNRMKSITIGGNVMAIEANAFSGCSGLTMITIPSKVKKIGTKAFYQCKNLRYIMIKTKKLTENNVGKNAFGRGYQSPRVKTDKNVWKRYSAILLQKGISKKALFVINPVKLNVYG